jgi:hypothetical protein
MGVLIGFCHHGAQQAALFEEHATKDEIEEFAEAYRVERAESVTMSGDTCPQCRAQYEANMRLIMGN